VTPETQTYTVRVTSRAL